MGTKEIWIKTGYEVFAHKGHSGIKIDPLAKKIGISKSSFYHHFADVDLFIEYLLAHHLKQSSIMAAKELQAKNIDPELINILIEHRNDLLFNRQLRINNDISIFTQTLLRSNKIVGDGFRAAWSKDLNVRLSPKQIDAIFSIALENFFLQINIDHINYEWLSKYFANLNHISNAIIDY